MLRSKLVLGFCAILLFAQGHSNTIPEDTQVDNSNYDDYGDGEDIPGEEVPEQSTAKIITKPSTIRARVGENVVLPCYVNDTENIVVSWNKIDIPGKKNLLFFDMTKMIEDDHINQEYGTNIIIMNVTRDDAADYECIITTTPPDSVTHKLIIETGNEPTVSVIPSKQEVKKGETITMTCKTRASEMPKFMWSFSGRRLHVVDQTLNSATIVIKNATRHNDGIYQCLADNGASEPPTASGRVIVHYPPEVEAEHEYVHTGTGIKSHLTCIVHAHPHAKVTWYHNNRPIPIDNTKYTTTNRKMKHTLNILHTHKSNFGVYTCKATNNLGEASKNITLQGTPSQPKLHQGEVDRNDDSTFILTWRLESYSPITEYKLEYRRAGEDQWEVATPQVTDGKDNQFTVQHPIEGIQPGSYEAVLSARNEYGWSPKSYPSSFSGEYRASETKNVQSDSSASHRTKLFSLLLLALPLFVHSRL